MTSFSTIVDVSVATIQGQLPAPVVFGDWIMKQREFAVVRLRTQSRQEGWAFTLTRDGAVAEQIRKTIAPVYIGTDVADLARTWRTAWRRSLASHCAIELRAKSDEQGAEEQTERDINHNGMHHQRICIVAPR